MSQDFTTLRDLVVFYRSTSAAYRRSIKHVVDAANRHVVETPKSVVRPRPSGPKEIEFLQVLSKYVNPQDIAVLPDEESREDAIDAALDAAEAAAGNNHPAARAILKDAIRLRKLRDQYQRRGGSMADPGFGQLEHTYDDVESLRWIDTTFGRPVTREDVIGVLTNDTP